jgi:hypothetical protein
LEVRARLRRTELPLAEQQLQVKQGQIESLGRVAATETLPLLGRADEAGWTLLAAGAVLLANLESLAFPHPHEATRATVGVGLRWVGLVVACAGDHLIAEQPAARVAAAHHFSSLEDARAAVVADRLNWATPESRDRAAAEAREELRDLLPAIPPESAVPAIAAMAVWVDTHVDQVLRPLARRSRLRRLAVPGDVRVGCVVAAGSLALIAGRGP